MTKQNPQFRGFFIFLPTSFLLVLLKALSIRVKNRNQKPKFNLEVPW